MKEALEIRKKSKAKKPKFTRHDSHKKAGVKENWRRPKGLQNKVRLGFRGYRQKPETGWRSPTEVRSRSQEGKEIVYVETFKQLEKVNAKEQTVILSSNLGLRKMLEMLNHMKKHSISLHDQNIDAQLKRIDDHISLRKKKAAQKKAEEAKKKDTKQAKLDEKVKKEEEVSDEERKKKEKELKEKILTKKE